MIENLICTVGTSLWSNLERIEEKNEQLRSLKKAFDSKNWPLLANELARLDPKERICGAEINTVYESLSKKWLDLRNLFLLVSDTEAGRETGEVLKHYFKQRKDLGLQNIEVKVVEKLQDERPIDFKVYGLRNLVREIGEILQRVGGSWGSAKNVAIDATGGYKAQIAVAVLIGQALDLPVYYKHERFSEIIDFPPLPITLDYDILGRNAEILADFEKGEVFSAKELDSLDPKLRVFLTEVEVDDQVIYELNAIGQVYLTSYRLRFPYIPSLGDLPDADRKAPTFGNDHHYPKGFKEFVHKVWEENKWIKSIFTLPYAGQAAIKGTGFRVEDVGEEVRLVGTFKSKDFGARFQVILADDSMEALNWAALRLNEKYRD
ncbi:MAG: putative CRISPR-associated protein [Methanobacteriota archaeon]|nr:MAG: putative CRISPR-associated protein [Euryarchaeota archaeon]